MANYFNLILDTIAPVSPSLVLADGVNVVNTQLITAKIGTTDTDTTGYSMKIWGSLDLAQAKIDGLVLSSAQDTTEESAQWVTFAPSKQLKLASGDGSKTIYLQLRDDVYNVSAQVSKSITLDTQAPVVSITGPDVTKISKQSGKNICTFSFTVDSDVVEYKVKVVTSASAAHTTGVAIGTAKGSTNMSGSVVKADKSVTCTITGADLELASSGDGAKIIKVFAKDAAGNWSI